MFSRSSKGLSNSESQTPAVPAKPASPSLICADLHIVGDMHSQGEIQIKNINFSYAGNQNAKACLFENFTLNIKAGEKIALVGHSGSGKTSLTKLSMYSPAPTIINSNLVSDLPATIDRSSKNLLSG